MALPSSLGPQPKPSRMHNRCGVDKECSGGGGPAWSPALEALSSRWRDHMLAKSAAGRSEGQGPHAVGHTEHFEGGEVPGVPLMEATAKYR